MTVCDVCKKNPATTRANAQLQLTAKRQIINKDLCKSCADLNAAILDDAATALVAALNGLKPAP